jgi:hypothetical protein
MKKKKTYWKAYVTKTARHTKKQDITDIFKKTTVSVGKCAVLLCSMFLIYFTVAELYTGRT